MRIVIDLQACQSAPHRERGIGRYSMAFTKALLRNAKDDEPWVVLNGEIPGTIEPIREALAGLIDKSHIAVWKSIPETAASSPANQWRRAAAAKVRSAFLAQLQPDVVHVSSLFEGYFDGVTSTIDAGNEFVSCVSLYDLIPLELPELYLTDARMRDWYMSKVEQLKHADLVFGISRYTCHKASELLKVPDERTIPVMAAVEPTFRRRQIDDAYASALLSRYRVSKPFVMFTGGIDPRKNIESLIKAYATLEPALRQQYQLVVVCDAQPDQRRRLQAIARQCGLRSGELVLTGFVGDAELVALYNLCHVFVFPSLNEGFGFPPLEAMACGAAVIGSRTSSVPEVIGDEDALFDPRDPASIADKLRAILTNEAFLTRLREHGLRQARAFSWDQCAQTALSAMREECEKRRTVARRITDTGSRKPLLAFISPLPPAQSGIADYSAGLLPALTEYYNVEAITDQPAVSDPWVRKHVPLRTSKWFEQHADRYDRVLYHMGNNSLHAHVFGMLQRHPGAVVLHEVFLSGLVAHLELTGEVPGFWTRGLYESHGYSALLDRSAFGGSAEIVERYPCSLSVIRDAEGVIVHSQHCKRIADHWFGADSTKNWSVVPLLRAVPEHVPREEARFRLGLPESEMLVCCFGIINPFKRDREILDAWFAGTLGKDRHCRLVFVGGSHHYEYGRELERIIAERDALERVHITGWVEPDTYHDYLAAADIAIQLRGSSRGETSAAILDCLAYGVPSIVNAHGSMAELPPDAVRMVPDDFSTVELAGALEFLANDAKGRKELGERGRVYCRQVLTPTRLAGLYRDAIERSAKTGPHRSLAKLASDIAGIVGKPGTADLDTLAVGIAANWRPVVGVRQLLVDISELVRRDAKTGIQRVVRSVIRILLQQPPDGFRIEPVYAEPGQRYRYARAFTTTFLNLPESILADEPVDADAGDVFLGLDLVPDAIPANRHELEAMHDRGVKMFFVVYDQLPLLRPDCFPSNGYGLFKCWMETIAELSDGLVCISRAVEAEVRRYLDLLQLRRTRPLKLGHYHLGADWHPSGSNSGITPEQKFCMERIRRETTFLVVGTVEPRKGHEQTLDAFELLWAHARSVNLVLVGKRGWMTDGLVRRIQNHAENGSRLLWFEQASDELLLCLYSACSALLLPSEGEGFGLPLIEAAQHGLPILCRDLPVFREIAAEHACYFSGCEGVDLKEAIDNWMALNEAGSAPSSRGMPWLNWEQATRQLLEVILHHRWDDAWIGRGDDHHLPDGGTTRDVAVISSTSGQGSEE